MNPDKNKLIIPEASPKRDGCPHCGAYDFSGRMIQGMVVRTCRGCGQAWAGGLPQQPQDPRVPRPYDPNVPTVDFVQKGKEVVEVRRRPDLTQPFRKGARIPDEGEE